MNRRSDRWWMRWYIVRSDPGSTAWGTVTEPDEWVEVGVLTKLGARHFCRAESDPALRPVRRTVWLQEH